MARTVLKFGGTSVADLDRIANVADIVAARAEKGERMAVVVSAMSGETNKLVGYAEGAAGDALPREQFDDEYDVVVASGEQVTAGLLALALRRRGLKARSWLGWQLRLKTNKSHGRARIMGFDDSTLPDAIDAGEIAVIAGFQGVTDDDRVATLGRGGSDTSAVAVAAALEASVCDIYTDVDGVYTTDPRIVPKAQRIEKISFEEMLELASLGAKVLQTRSVEMAMNHNVPVRVLSSFLKPGEPNPGTIVCSEEEIVEKQVVSGVAYSRDEAKVTLYGVPDKPGISAKIFSALARAGVNVDWSSRRRRAGRNRPTWYSPAPTGTAPLHATHLRACMRKLAMSASKLCATCRKFPSLVLACVAIPASQRQCSRLCTRRASILT